MSGRRTTGERHERQATGGGKQRSRALDELMSSMHYMAPLRLIPKTCARRRHEAYGISTAPDERGGAPSSARAADPTINTRHYTSYFGTPTYKVFVHCLPSSPIHASLHSTHERTYQYRKHQASSKTGMQMGCRALAPRPSTWARTSQTCPQASRHGPPRRHVTGRGTRTKSNLTARVIPTLTRAADPTIAQAHGPDPPEHDNKLLDMPLPDGMRQPLGAPVCLVFCEPPAGRCFGGN